MNDYIYMWLIDYFIFYNNFDNDVVVFLVHGDHRSETN